MCDCVTEGTCHRGDRFAADLWWRHPVDIASICWPQTCGKSMAVTGGFEPSCTDIPKILQRWWENFFYLLYSRCTASIQWAAFSRPKHVSSSTINLKTNQMGIPRSCPNYPHSLKHVTSSASISTHTGQPKHPLRWLVGCVAQLAERRSLAGELTLFCARPLADGVTTMWVNRPLKISQLGQLSLSSFQGR